MVAKQWIPHLRNGRVFTGHLECTLRQKQTRNKGESVRIERCLPRFGKLRKKWKVVGYRRHTESVVANYATRILFWYSFFFFPYGLPTRSSESLLFSTLYAPFYIGQLVVFTLTQHRYSLTTVQRAGFRCCKRKQKDISCPWRGSMQKASSLWYEV